MGRVTSALHTGTLWHRRSTPFRHEFNYPCHVLALDLTDAEEAGRPLRLFGVNRRRLYSIRDRDYLDGADRPIADRFREALRARGLGDGVARIVLATVPRCLGRAFNPVSFYFAFDADGGLRCAAAEVNNTFGDRHLYILDRPLPAPPGFLARYRHPKEFHVSPFHEAGGEYEFLLADIRESLDITVDLYERGEPVYRAQWRGAERMPLTDRALARLFVRQPLAAALTFPRILRQAAHLYFTRRLPVHTRPEPDHPSTIVVAAPSRWERFCRDRTLAFFSGVREGALALRLPGGATQSFGPASAPSAEIRIRSHRAFTRLVRHGDIGFGEGFMAGDWESPDLVALLRLFARNLGPLDDRRQALSWIGRAGNRVRHALRRNTRTGSRRNIAAHYDLSNDFFRLWLDETMMYSCAVFESPEDDLRQAQVNKLRRLVRKARIGPEHHVLEIGSGWGGFAIEAARSTGCRVTTLTLSTEQQALARERVAAAGLADRIDVRLVDYRDAEGTYDRIVSIEMLEAVGAEYFGTFFRRCDELLKPDGLVVLQVITIPDQRYEAYRFASDWIQKHIFPGGLLPSLTVLSREMTRDSRLFVEDLENIGIHYARTLREWRERFMAHREEVRALGFDESFLRAWEYYLAYCGAGFAERVLNNLQLVLTRAGNRSLPAAG